MQDPSSFKQFGMIDKKILKGMHTMIVLTHIEKKSTYPYALLKRFRASRHPMLSGISKSELYNILGSLEHQGYVRGKVVLAGSKVQKVYSITPKGDDVAKSFRRVFFSFIRSASKIITGAFSE